MQNAKCRIKIQNDRYNAECKMQNAKLKYKSKSKCKAKANRRMQN